MNEITLACQHFENLLKEQLERLKSMDKPVKDFSKMDTITIGIAPGDGIGPIIMEQAERVLKHLLKDEIASGKVVIQNIEGLTIENRLALNQPVPADTLAQIKSCDVLLKGPTTTPMGGKMESANVTLRRGQQGCGSAGYGSGL